MRRITIRAATVAAASVIAGMPTSLHAGGSPENAVLIIDPTDAQSLYVGNYYKNARNIPDSNVLYLRSAATNYGTFVTSTEVAFKSALTLRAIGDHTDYVVLAPLNVYTVPFGDPDSISLTAAYSLAPISLQVLTSFTNATNWNGYGFPASVTNPPLAFHAQTRYWNGVPSADPAAKSYYISALLGYTPSLGNTVPEILAMIDRSVGADATHPAGTFYFMNAPDAPRNLRACGVLPSCPQANPPVVYNDTAASITALGAAATVINGDLPPANTTGVLGVLSGFSNAAIAGANLGLVPGAFADHFTSSAGAVNCSVNCQTPVSEWIRAGASGSAGTVVEPGRNLQFFPTPDFHRYYFQGMSLGESYLRSLRAAPSFSLLYGDPLTRPFAYLPSVSILNPPLGTKSGTITLTPSATTSRPGASIAGYDLLVDGVRMASANFGQSFTLNTAALSDGRHDLRVLAHDNSAVEDTGRWVGTLDTNNYGHTATLSVSSTSGNLAQLFAFSYAASSAGLKEVRLTQNGRVLAAATSAAGTLSVYGQNLGAGTSTVRLEAWYADNRLAWSAPVSMTVTASGSPTGAVPVPFSYTKVFTSTTTQIVELPAAFDSAPAGVTYTLLNAPAKASILSAAANLPYRIIQPYRGAAGSEQLQFRVTTSGGTSTIATVTLVYAPRVTIIAPPSGSTSAIGTASTPGRQGGHALYGLDYRASLWSGTSTSRIDLQPASASSSTITDVSSAQQVGNVYFGSTSHASLWTGTAASWVDLTPAGATRSNVEGVESGLQAGSVTLSGIDRASLWSGTAGSRIDLHPATGALASYATGTSGTFVDGHSQVGYVVIPSGHTHAALWRNLAPWIDLHPAGATDSFAYDVHQGSVDGSTGQQVGAAFINGNSHASAWTGTAASWVDLNPAGAIASSAYSVLYSHDSSQFLQVGSATIGSLQHASLWTSTAASWLDLSVYLPAEYAGYSSEARSISMDDEGVYVVGSAKRAGGEDLVVWRLL